MFRIFFRFTKSMSKLQKTGKRRKLTIIIRYLIISTSSYLFYYLIALSWSSETLKRNDSTTRRIKHYKLQKNTKTSLLLHLDDDVTVLQSASDSWIPSTNHTRCVDYSGAKPMENISEAFQWQPVDRGNNNSFIFSAFYDSRSIPPTVHIIGISTGSIGTKFCQMWFREETSPIYVTARFRYTTSDFSKRYASSSYDCYVNESRVPFAVSVVSELCQYSSTNLLFVRNNHLKSRPLKRNFTVCVTPFSFNYNNHLQLVEMIEVNRLFGAEKFIFYNYSVGDDLLSYLKSYEEEELVEILPWKLPVVTESSPTDLKSEPEIHYFGQFAALNDCLYRNLFLSRFTVFSDLDELIVPRGSHKTWMEVMESATRRVVGNLPFDQTQKFPGAYVFRNAFFRSDWGNDSMMENDKIAHGFMLRTLLKTNRESFIYPWYLRSKYIAWTKMVSEAGVHSVARFLDNSKVVSVDVAAYDALLHHYRLTMWPDDKKKPPQVTRDRHMHRLYHEITSRTLERHHRVVGTPLGRSDQSESIHIAGM